MVIKNNTSLLAGSNIKFFPSPREKRDLKFEKTGIPLDIDSKVTLSREALTCGTPPEEVVTDTATEKKPKTSAGFKIESIGSTIIGNLKGSSSNPTTLTMIEDQIGDNLKPVITGKLNTSILQVPDTRQSTDYSCGASSLQAVLMYWGMEFMETELMDMLHTTKEGTKPTDIVRVGQELGFEAELKENLTLEDLEKSVKAGVPVIVDGQAWREGDDLNKPWTDLWEHGHYMVVIGMDDENVIIEDPSLLGSQGFIPRKEFLDRWHDYEKDEKHNRHEKSIKEYIHTGIFIRGAKPSPPPPLVHIG
jgi:uncharacterized protein